jgi:hypothetical protein
VRLRIEAVGPLGALVVARPGEKRLRQIGVPEIGAAKISARQTRVPQIGAPKISIDEDRTCEISTNTIICTDERPCAHAGYASSLTEIDIYYFPRLYCRQGSIKLVRVREDRAMSDNSPSALLQEPVKQEVPTITSPGTSSIDPEEILDWDVCIEIPPPRPHGTLAVQLVCAGRGKPTPVDDLEVA